MLRRNLAVATIAFALFVLISTDAVATAQRTFVASTGNDANPCSLASPCRSFAAAITKTSAGGEVIALDSGGYGPLIITQSVSIIAPAGVFAGISVTPTLDGIVVNGAAIIVTLKGLSISGQGGNIGINFLQGAQLVIDRCTVTGMGAEGVSAAATGANLTITDTVVRGNSGVGGLAVTSAVQGSIVRSRFESNVHHGVFMDHGATISIAETAVINNAFEGIVAVSDVSERTTLAADRLEVRGNESGVVASAGGGTVVAHITRSNLSQNTMRGMELYGVGTVDASITDSMVVSNGEIGVFINTVAGTSLTLTVEGNRISNNFIGLRNDAGGTMNTRGNNSVFGNSSTNVLGTLTPLGAI
jgi:hypothetical protein